MDGFNVPEVGWGPRPAALASSGSGCVVTGGAPRAFGFKRAALWSLGLVLSLAVLGVFCARGLVVETVAAVFAAVLIAACATLGNEVLRGLRSRATERRRRDEGGGPAWR
ncbi:hypothetical protein [Streptomyces sp. BPTC-684]|uniref:hypothetical protein n=1 Tax=Streptomyces sp. BPTC-684 TaxID=3043734 RepID=UPI0024B1F67D|nr:hypothetical protein [Streptomyces sp. BPTC-684]WHM41106.1 hypothetical protein QIY60_32450 [Streptomyces sp. BPTC-684]